MVRGGPAAAQLGPADSAGRGGRQLRVGRVRELDRRAHVHMHTYAIMHTCNHAYMQPRTSAHMHTCIHAHQPAWTPGHQTTWTRGHLDTWTRAHTHTHANARAHMYADMRTRAHLVRPGRSSTHDKVGTVGCASRRRRWTHWDVYASKSKPLSVPEFYGTKIAAILAQNLLERHDLAEFRQCYGKTLVHPFLFPL